MKLEKKKLKPTQELRLRIKKYIMNWKSNNIIVSSNLSLPNDKIEIWDVIVLKHIDWAIEQDIPWENWHHAGLISKISWDKIWYAQGNKIAQWPIERDFNESVFAWDDLLELVLLKPKFPNPIREKSTGLLSWINRNVISENEAREKAIEYARSQIWKPYKYKTTKWNDDDWYCSKLVFKAYSMTIWMYLEVYQFPSLWILPVAKFLKTISSWPAVTPEDLIDSKRTEIYYHYKK